MNDSPNSDNPFTDDNPYASPDATKPARATVGPSGELSLPPGQIRGMIAHVQVIGILMIIQGVMSSLYRTFRRSRSRFDGFFESGVSYGHGGQGSFVRATNVVMGALVEWLRRADAP